MDELSPFQAPAGSARDSAVLVLFGEGPTGPDVLLIRRADRLRDHAGQPAFPGGASEPADADAAATALREATEETGLDPAGVQVLATLAPLYLRPSGYHVTPVLAWWREPSTVAPADPGEVAAVVRVPIAELADAGNQVQVRHPSGRQGPGFRVRGLLVWGFTAGLLARLLAAGGLLEPAGDRPLVEPAGPRPEAG